MLGVMLGVSGNCWDLCWELLKHVGGYVGSYVVNLCQPVGGYLVCCVRTVGSHLVSYVTLLGVMLVFISAHICVCRDLCWCLCLKTFVFIGTYVGRPHPQQQQTQQQPHQPHTPTTTTPPTTHTTTTTPTQTPTTDTTTPLAHSPLGPGTTPGNKPGALGPVECTSASAMPTVHSNADSGQKRKRTLDANVDA